MKILIFSDTHNRVQPMLDMISRHNPDMVIHLGDYLSDVKEVVRTYPNLTCHYVLGNSDYGAAGEYEKTLNLSGKTILLTHGHLYGVKSGLQNLKSAAKRRGADIVMYGHTHIPQNGFDSGLYMLNPGAISRPMTGKRTFALAEISDEFKIVIEEC